VEAVGDEPGQEPQLKPGVLILEIAAAPLCLGHVQTDTPRLCNAFVLPWSYENEGLQDASSVFFFVEGS
jgi:hypothetical protein